MRTRVLAALAGVLLLGPVGASAAPIAPTLASLLLNVDGATYDSLVDGAIPGSLGGATVDASGFDAATGMGILRFRLTGAGVHTVLGFFDIDLREDQEFTNDLGTTVGAPAAGESWEIDRPNGDIYDHSVNTTAAASLLSNSDDLIGPDDVSLALARTFLLNPAELAFIEFIGSEADFGISAGLRLRVSDQSSLNAYALSSALRVDPGQVEPTPVPEPGTLLLLGAGCMVIARTLRRRTTCNTVR